MRINSIVFWLKRTLLTLIFYISALQHGLAYDAKLAQDIASDFTPLPERPDKEEPNYKGKKFVFWHALRDMYERKESRDPKSEDFFYKDFVGYEPDVEVELKILHDIYHRLLGDYLLWKNKLNLEEKNYTKEVEISFELAKLTSNISLAQYAYKTLLIQSTRKMIDLRRARPFLFTMDFDSDHRPLEALFDLSHGSAKGQQVLDSVIASYYQQINSLYKETHQLVSYDLFKGSGIEDIQKIRLKFSRYLFSVELLTSRMMPVVQYANDVLLDRIKGVNKVIEIENLMSTLGKSLMAVLEEVETYKRNKTVDTKERDASLLYFSDPRNELPKLIEETFLESSYLDVGSGKIGEKAKFFKDYEEAVVGQYIIAAATFMSKILDTKTVRGNWLERSQQELRYRLAQSKALIGIRSKDSQDRNLVVFDRKNPVDGDYSRIMRRQFVRSKGRDTRIELEERMWRAFFIKIENKPAFSSKTLALMQGGNQCMSIFRSY